MEKNSVRGVALFFACCLVIVGCSIKPVYNNLDRLITWQVSDYLDLTRDQKVLLREELAVLLEWHRDAHLVMYADFLSSLPASISDGVSSIMIEELFEQMLTWGDEVEDRMLPLMGKVLVSMSESQIDRMEQKFKESNEEFVSSENDGSVEDYREGWAEEIEESLERFTGSLTSNQLSYLKLKSLAYRPERLLWAEYWKRWQSELLVLMRSEKNAEFYIRFEKLIKTREAYYGIEFKEVYEENLELSREVAAHILSELTDNQRGKLKKTLNKLSLDLRELAEEN